MSGRLNVTSASGRGLSFQVDADAYVSGLRNEVQQLREEIRRLNDRREAR